PTAPSLDRLLPVTVMLETSGPQMSPQTLTANVQTSSEPTTQSSSQFFVMRRRGTWDLTFDMSGGAKGAKRPLGRPLDGGVRPHEIGRAPSREGGTIGTTLRLWIEWIFREVKTSPD